VLSRFVEHGLTLGVHLQLKDSVISGLAFDSLSKRSALNEVTYRVLLQWKRTASAALRPRPGQGPSAFGVPPAFTFATTQNNNPLIDQAGARQQTGNLLVQQLVSALQAMELTSLAAAVIFAAASDLELTEPTIRAALIGPLPFQNGTDSQSSMDKMDTFTVGETGLNVPHLHLCPATGAGVFGCSHRVPPFLVLPERLARQAPQTNT